MIRWTGLAPWGFESPFPGSLTSTFLAQEEERLAQLRREVQDGADSALDQRARLLESDEEVLPGPSTSRFAPTLRDPTLRVPTLRVPTLRALSASKSSFSSRRICIVPQVAGFR